MERSIASAVEAAGHRLYLDEDLSKDLGALLRADGLDAFHTRELGRAGATDPQQLAFAVEENRTIITANLVHFRMLHEAWILSAPLQNPTNPRPHPGIVAVPNPNVMSAETMARLLADFVRGGLSSGVENRLLEWRIGHGWRDLTAVG